MSSLLRDHDPEWPQEQHSGGGGGGDHGYGERHGGSPQRGGRVGATSSKPLATALEALLAPQSDNEIWLIERVEELQEQQKGTNQLLRDVLVRLKAAERGAHTKEQEWTEKWAELDQGLQQEVLSRKEAESRNRVLAEETTRAKQEAHAAQAMAAAERKEVRVANQAHKAVIRMEERETASAFLPWLQAARAKQAADKADEVEQMRSEVYDRMAELGSSLQADLADALERADEKLQTGLAETARLLDQKMEQTSNVVHEQMQQVRYLFCSFSLISAVSRSSSGPILPAARPCDEQQPRGDQGEGRAGRDRPPDCRQGGRDAYRGPQQV